jgi:hypothetical protein
MDCEDGGNDGEERMLTPKEVVEKLRTYGTIVSEEEAEKILEFMITFARITLSEYENSRPVYPGKHGRASR